MEKRLILRLITLPVLLAAASILPAQTVSTFEMRHLTSDPKADGVTDFHGPTEWLDVDARMAALGEYARFASRFWGDPGMDRPLFTDDDVSARLSGIKRQPLPSVRKTLRLEQWKAYGYKPGKEAVLEKARAGWTSLGGVIRDGALVLDGVWAEPPVPELDWRFRLKVSLRGTPSGVKVILGTDSGREIALEPGSLGEFEVYGDLAEGRIFLSSSGKTLREIPVQGTKKIVSFRIGAPSGKAAVEDVSLYAFVWNGSNEPRTPYLTRMVFDDDFNPVPSMQGWQDEDYDDTLWETVQLPSPHGCERAAGECYYLRTVVDADDFFRARLEIETLDPAGEIWVNGEPAAVLDGRVPRSLDITGYLHPGRNTIAVKVKPFRTETPVFHAPSDRNYGWFLGRTELVLTKAPERISEALVHTLAIKPGEAVQHHKVTVRNDGGSFREGTLTVNYYPWFPEEGDCVASSSMEVGIRPWMDNVFEMDVTVRDPRLWNTFDPQLYRVEVVFIDDKGNPADDYVTTTGIRRILQDKGVLYINGRPEIIGGGQIFGYRLPVEYSSLTIRCATGMMVMRELMMAKSLGNLLRIHVHGETGVPDGINDPRFAEYADQLGLYLIWQTSAWTREGEAWNVDIASYPLYMKQVFNHPSIVMWEASNHPTQFKNHPFKETRDYMDAIIPAIVLTDSSRLVSPTSYWRFTRYGNYDGTIDFEGNPLEPDPWLMHRMMTRGSQDSYSGYENDWGSIRNIPNQWAKSCLEARDLCYFNFEHEESIAQPNWELARKEPWYHVSSYEKNYEKGSLGRLLDFSEWKESQAYQAFSAWESMKIQTIQGVSGFSWCSLESGPNMFTYQKPLVDPFLVPKLAFHANRMAFGRLWAGSADADVVYGPGDMVRPVVFNLDGECTADLVVELQDTRGKVLEKKTFRNIAVPAGRSVTHLEPFRFRSKSQGCRFIVYKLTRKG